MCTTTGKSILHKVPNEISGSSVSNFDEFQDMM